MNTFTASTIKHPVSGAELPSIPEHSTDDVATAVERARAAQPAWEALGFRGRERIMRRVEKLLHDEREQIVDVIQRESGKSRRDAVNEVFTLAGTIRRYRVTGRRALRTRRDRPPLPLITSAQTRWVPRGVIGFITPWNFPLLLGCGDSVPALLAGNTVVSKPSELTPHSAVRYAQLLHDAGVPDDVYTLVHGPGSTIGADLIPRVDYVGFTGSEATGRIVGAAAGALLVPCSLELGGKNAMIIAQGANINNVVTGLIPGAFVNAGQTCISIERVLVDSHIHDEFLAELTRRVNELTLGYSEQYSADIGSLISAEHADSVRQAIESAVQRGGRICANGKAHDSGNEHFCAPTVLVGVPDDDPLNTAEVFGPIITVAPFHTLDEAVQRANESGYGLHASVWAGSRRAGRRIARRLRTGTVTINATLMIYNAYGTPMGGVAGSGYGRRHGPEGIRRFTREQGIATSVAAFGGYDALTRLTVHPRGVRLIMMLSRALKYLPGIR